MEATNVVHLLNQTSLPTTFRWEAPQGSDTAFAQAEVIPGQGMLAGREEMALAVKLKVSKVVSDIFFSRCFLLKDSRLQAKGGIKAEQVTEFGT